MPTIKPVRKITIEFSVDWEDYEDVVDELVVEDMFENWPGKDGVSYEIIPVLVSPLKKKGRGK